MLRFSANLSLLFTEYEWLDRFKAAKDHGFTAVEIQFPYHLPAEQLQAALEQSGLQLVMFNIAADTLLQGGEGLAAVPEKQQQFSAALAQAVSYAEILQPKLINVLPGRCLNPARQAEYLLTFKQNLRLATETLAELGIKTVFEAINIHDMPGFLIHNSQQMLDVLADIAHPMLGLQYDIYHMRMMGEDCAAFLQQHMDSIGHIQFADCPGRGQPGSGAIEFKSLFSLIKASAYQGWVGAEYRPAGKTSTSLAWQDLL